MESLKKKKVDDIVFNLMTTAADKSSVDINQLPSEVKREHSIRGDQKFKEKEKKDKKSTLSNYGGALHLKDIRRVKDGKEKDKKESS